MTGQDTELLCREYLECKSISLKDLSKINRPGPIVSEVSRARLSVTDLIKDLFTTLQTLPEDWYTRLFWGRTVRTYRQCLPTTTSLGAAC